MNQSQRDNGTGIRNVLTFDVEDWFHGFGLSPAEQRHLPHRLQVGLLRILDILDAHQVRATFFILGSLADEYGSLLGSIADAGHEIATHGYQHTLVYHLSPADFAHDLYKALSAIHSIAGQPVKSYRAPFFPITNRNLWALPILVKAGITRNSSIVPAHNPRYGIPDADRFPYPVFTNYPPKLAEYPVSTVPIGNVNLPFGGDFYARLLPYRLIRSAVERLNADGQPAVFYFHPWELDPDHPRISQELPALYRFTHYYKLGCTAGKLQALLRDFSFGPLAVAPCPRTPVQQPTFHKAYAG